MTPYSFFILMCLLFGTGSIWYGCNTESTVIFEYKVPYDSIPDGKGVEIPDFEIPQGVKVCEIILRLENFILPQINNLPSYGKKYNGYISAEIFDDEGNESCQLEGDVYHDFGVDEGEPWSENLIYTSKIFKIDTAGMFSADVFFERGEGLYNDDHKNISIPDANLVFQVRTGEDEMSNTIIGAGFIVLILGIVMAFTLIKIPQNQEDMTDETE